MTNPPTTFKNKKVIMPIDPIAKHMHNMAEVQNKLGHAYLVISKAHKPLVIYFV